MFNVNYEALKKDERADKCINCHLCSKNCTLGFLQEITGFINCRLRIYEDIARIEIPADKFKLLIENKFDLINELTSQGLKYITLDIEGLKSGSMD